MAKKKKPATRAEIRELLHLLTVLSTDIVAKTVQAACIVRSDMKPQMCLSHVLDVRQMANSLCGIAHKVANEIDPEPPFPNPHDRRNYPRGRKPTRSKV
jgi:hypothetical protein